LKRDKSQVLKKIDDFISNLNDNSSTEILVGLLNQCCEKKIPATLVFNAFKDKLLSDSTTFYYRSTTLSKMINGMLLNQNSRYINDVLNEILLFVHKSNEDINNKNVDEIFAEAVYAVKNRMDHAINEFETAKDKQQKEIDGLLPRVIEVIGIFIAIITVIFGGLNIIASFDNMDDVSALRLVGSSFLIAFLLFNVLFFLIFLISRITGKPIHVVCGRFTNPTVDDPQYKTCNKCFFNRLDDRSEIFRGKGSDLNIDKDELKNYELNNHEQCGLPKKAFSHYPWFWLANFVLLAAELCMVTIWLSIAMIEERLLETSELYGFIALMFVIVALISYMAYRFLRYGGKIIRVKHIKAKKCRWKLRPFARPYLKKDGKDNRKIYIHKLGKDGRRPFNCYDYRYNQMNKIIGAVCAVLILGASVGIVKLVDMDRLMEMGQEEKLKSQNIAHEKMYKSEWKNSDSK
jgi:hypothetical protein